MYADKPGPSGIRKESPKVALETPSESYASLPYEIKSLLYYQGFLPRKDAEDMCMQPGDFLIRRARIQLPNERLMLDESLEDLENISMLAASAKKSRGTEERNVASGIEMAPRSSPRMTFRSPTPRMPLNYATPRMPVNYPTPRLGTSNVDADESLIAVTSLASPKIYGVPLQSPGVEGSLVARDWGIVLTIRVSMNKIRHIGFPRQPDGSWKINSHQTTSNLANYLEDCHWSRKPVRLGLDDKLVQMKHAIPAAFWLYPHKKIRRPAEAVARGSFGRIFRGAIILDSERELVTAIKCLPNDKILTKHQHEEFISEAMIMRRLEHPNVVKFRGVAISELPIMILMEWCSHGDLNKHLEKYGHRCSMEDRLRYSLEAARGLYYLSINGIVHRDIAARNCLFGDDWRLKIADFGLARTGDTIHDEKALNPYYQPPESLSMNIFTTKTDVWSYGILLYEIYTNGHVPYEEHVGMYRTMMAVIRGEKPKEPIMMPDEIKMVMRRCHETLPSDRPTFSQIRKRIEDIYYQLYGVLR